MHSDEPVPPLSAAALEHVAGGQLMEGRRYVASDSADYKAIRDAGDRAASKYYRLDPRWSLAQHFGTRRAADSMEGKPTTVLEVPLAGAYLCPDPDR
jgi:hypothetical protein